MKSQTIKVLRGRLELAVAAFDHAERKRLEDLERLTRAARRANMQLALTAFEKKAFARARTFVEFEMNSDGYITAKITDAARAVVKKLQTQFGIDEKNYCGYAHIECFSLGIRAGVRPATVAKFKPLFDAIDQQFVSADGADIEALIAKFLA